MVLASCEAPPVSDTLVGYVEGEFVYVAPPQSGWIASMPVLEGATVAPGDLLFELDKDQETLQYREADQRVAQATAQARNIETGARPAEIAELEARVEEAEAQLVLAQAEYDRVLPLVAKGFESKARGDVVSAELQRSKARAAAARTAINVARLAGRDAEQQAADASREAAVAAREQVEWRRDQRSVQSRVPGRVEYLFHRVGEFVTAGSPVLAILPDNALKVRFFIPLNRLSGIAPGGMVQVTADGMENPIDATISFIATEAEFTPPVIYSVESRDKLVFMVEARLPVGADLRPGLPVDIRLP